MVLTLRHGMRMTTALVRSRMALATSAPRATSVRAFSEDSKGQEPQDPVDMLGLDRLKSNPKLVEELTSQIDDKELEEEILREQRDFDKPYDVLVVGGGIVGSALACQLKSSPVFKGKRVGVVEPMRPPPATSTTHDLRVYTLTPASQKVLEQAQTWQLIPEHEKPSFQHMQVWDSMGDGHIRFNAQKMGRKELAWVVEGITLGRALHARMNALTKDPNDPEPLRLFCPAKVKSFERPGEYNTFSTVGLEDGNKIQAKLVIAADGGRSMIRTLSGLGSWGWDYDQSAVVCNVKTDTVNDTAWQRFFPTGPLALLPVRDGLTSIVWSMPHEEARKLTNCSPEEFIEKLQEALFAPSQPPPPAFPGIPVLSDLCKGVHGAVTGIMSAAALADPFVQPPKPVELVGRRASFPLKMNHAVSYVKPGVALIGDSAHSIHPLAGQGLNLGLGDVDSLAKVLIDGVKFGQNLQSVDYLRRYEEDRKRANVSMAMAMDGFKRLFGTQPDAVAVARNVGMGTLNAVEPLKNQIMRYAMGL